MKNLEHYIELINTAQTPEEAFERYCSIMAQHGYERIAYSLCTDHPSLNLPRQHGLATSYPEDWMNYYNEKNYIEVDPVVHKVLQSRKPFFWSDLDVPNELKILNEAEDAGIWDGLGLSLVGQSGELVGVGLARKGTEKGRDYNFLAAAHLLTVYFHETFRDLIAQPIKPKLTTRELEVLSWAAEGKGDEDIATLLNISFSTVRYHWGKIYKKLEAYGKLYAVTKAIRLQLITPNYVRAPLPIMSGDAVA